MNNTYGEVTNGTDIDEAGDIAEPRAERRRGIRAIVRKDTEPSLHPLPRRLHLICWSRSRPIPSSPERFHLVGHTKLLTMDA